jgi:hypothetical protein
MQHASFIDALIKQNVSGLPVADYLQQVSQQHPYFTPAQFYLLQQLQHSHNNYRHQAAKTAVLFNNPYWLQFQLQQLPDLTAAKETPVIDMFVAEADNSANTTEAAEQDAAVPVEIQQSAAEHIEPKATNNKYEPIAAIEETNSTDTPEDQEQQTEQEMPPIKIDLAASIKEAENEHALSFEPMHLVDYFASQGIKLSDDIQTADKLGKQLKSFTEWLKTMKKVHAGDPETGAAATDVTIQTMAEKSNTEDEMVTEAMAEVFAQQGKTRKAIDVYKKLSLLNPLKSAFFAAKIEQLKGS